MHFAAELLRTLQHMHAGGFWCVGTGWRAAACLDVCDPCGCKHFVVAQHTSTSPARAASYTFCPHRPALCASPSHQLCCVALSMQPGSCTRTSSRTTCWSRWMQLTQVRRHSGGIDRAACGCSWELAGRGPEAASCGAAVPSWSVPCWPTHGMAQDLPIPPPPPPFVACLIRHAGDENAAPSLGLQLIDFGRGVDLELLPPGTLLQVGGRFKSEHAMGVLCVGPAHVERGGGWRQGCSCSHLGRCCKRA